MDTSPSSLQALQAELRGTEGLDLLTSPGDLERYSRDAYDYSPVLAPLLRHCRAQLVVRPHCVAAVMAVAGACARAAVPLTLRGAGTGNYGQCVPLKAGVVMLMGELNTVRDLDPSTGVVQVESGVILKDLDRSLGCHGHKALFSQTECFFFKLG